MFGIDDLLIMAGITAAASAASGIAGASQNQANMDNQSQQNALDRQLQQRLAQQQIAEQKRQANLSATQSAYGSLSEAYGQQAQLQNTLAGQQQQNNNDLMGTLSRAYLSGSR
jgi:hypothetical protein